MCVFVDNLWLHAQKDADRRVFLLGSIKEIPLNNVKRISSIHLTRRYKFLEVTVYQNQVEKALKVLKRQMTKEGLLKELKRRRFYEKPSVKKKRKQKEAKKKRKAAMRRMRSYNRM